MKAIHVPQINARYWVAIAMASVFGTNMGDLYAHDSGLGIIGGLPVLAAIVAVAYCLERRDDRQHEAWYWLAIIVIRTGATNIADYLCGRRYVGLNRFALSAGLAVLIATLAWRRTAGRADTSGLPQTDAKYWLAMLAAGVLGTALGDALQRLIGSVTASVALTALLIAILLFGSRRRIQTVYFYWLAVAVARTAGTAIGDLLAENKQLNIGLNISTLITGFVFVSVLLFWRSAPKLAPATG
jgi:uncharacterized membrane-anchored protein